MSFSTDEAWSRAKTLAPFPNSLTAYYQDLLHQYEGAHLLASKARSAGLDPIGSIESKTVFDLADRVNQMLGLGQFEGLVDRLRDLLKSTTKERAALTISQEIALGKFGGIDKQKALDYGIRAGLAVMTDGVTVAPLEGIYSVTIKQNDDNSDYASVSYAGPMRSAGGTEAGFSLVIADVTAKKLGLSNYRARSEEVDRYVEELRIYEREVGNFQFKVTDDDIRYAISNLPVEIDGVETDPVEVVVHRNLKHVGTDRMRGGALRVLNDGVIGRANKLTKKLVNLNITGWEWLAQLRGGTQQTTNETEQAGAHFEEVISGRAVLSMPKRKGGFRLRFGRSVNTGLSAIGIHPAVATILDYPVVAGTQVKVDLPGKAATIAFVDTIEGPTALLRDGTVKRVNTVAEAEALRGSLLRLIDLGDVLISYGDFLENNKNLPPSPYVVEWWAEDVLNALVSIPDAEQRLADARLPAEKVRSWALEPFAKVPTPREALAVSRSLAIPLHPSYTPRFDRVSIPDMLELRNNAVFDGSEVVVDLASQRALPVLQNALIEHTVEGKSAVVRNESAFVLAELLGLGREVANASEHIDSLDLIQSISGIRLGRQTTTTIGVRVGRPEKAMVRRLKPPVHGLFPVGNAGGPSRDINKAAKQGTIEIEIANRVCPSCNERRTSPKCETCGDQTTRFLSCPRCGITTEEPTCPSCGLKTNTYSEVSFDLKGKLELLKTRISFNQSKPVKGVRGLTSQSKTPEPIQKAITRSKHDVYVYKDGTLRIDITNAPLTHFRPSDVGAEPGKLAALGYTEDHKGAPLVDSSQLLELKPQDIIVPIDIAEDLVRMAQFVDDELQSVYGLPAFYNVAKPEDVIGKIVIGLAPHTSVGVVGRIVGYAPTQVCFANPCWHAAKRRDCDGDGDSLLLLLDVFLNFSIEFLPNQIGGLMDTPLLVQPILLPAEVDEQAHNFDIAASYPRAFYEQTKNSPPASSLQASIELIGSRLDSERQFLDYGFTHATSTLTVKHSRAAYSTMRTLAEKISKQIEVADRVGAVSTKEVVESIIKNHLIRDIMGNTKKYATQSFKCKKCGMTLRRPPLSWACPNCGGELRETLTRASVEKYLRIAQRLARDYDVDPYLRSRLDVVEHELDQLFQGKRKPEQLELTDFTGTVLAEEVRR
ncbi:MAG TPA: DNA polymerase II large subunit [Nitrososphaerales archaeon]|nr:DNA polymerase II large subunit [Nitrososphaerales archaeon]